MYGLIIQSKIKCSRFESGQHSDLKLAADDAVLI